MAKSLFIYLILAIGVAATNGQGDFFVFYLYGIEEFMADWKTVMFVI